jgi:hypothetical protein
VDEVGDREKFGKSGAYGIGITYIYLYDRDLRVYRGCKLNAGLDELIGHLLLGGAEKLERTWRGFCDVEAVLGVSRKLA